MKPYFQDEAKVEALQEALRERRGTPFRINMGEIGKGYDCWHFVVDVYAATGLDVEPLRAFRTQSLNWGRFHRHSLLIDFLHGDERCRRFIKRIEPEEPILPGDLLAIRQGLSCNHLAVAEDAVTAWHVPRGGRVSTVTVQSLRTTGVLHAIFRIHQ